MIATTSPRPLIFVSGRVLVPDRRGSDWRGGSEIDRRGMDKECQQLLKSQGEEFQKMINLNLGAWIQIRVESVGTTWGKG